MDQKISDDSKKSSEKSNTSNIDTTKGEPAYIRDLPTWILEEPKGVVGKKRIENNTGGASNTALEKASWYATSQKTTVSGPVPHQAVEEALSN